MKKLISIILPIYNEEKNIPLVYAATSRICQTFSPTYDYEILFINDGSKDSSWQLLQELALSDNRVRVFNFSRNFGHQIALTAGYDHSRGDIIISMDADLQDPPELINNMVKKWEEGSEVVYARRINRKDNFLKKITAIVYYRLLERVSDVNIPRNVGDFRLIDKKVLMKLRECREKSRYLRGMIAWLGFKSSFVDFARPNREHGETGYTWSKMLKFAFDGMTSFSMFPLKIAAFVGVFVILTGSLMLGYITFDALLHSTVYPLFKWLVTVIYIFMGVMFLLVWLVGEYVGRIYEQQQNRPLYVIAESSEQSHSPHLFNNERCIESTQR